MEKGFDRAGFIEYLENEFSGFENPFLRETVDNIISFGLENKNYSMDEFCYFLSDMLPEVEFKDVALYMDDEYFTEQGKEFKREKVQELMDVLENDTWLDDLIRAAYSVPEHNYSDALSSDGPPKEAQESLRNVVKYNDEER